MLKNLKEKLGKGFSKRKIISIAIFAVVVIAIIIASVINQSNEQSSRRKKIIADGELARAMTYDQFVDGDEAVDGTDNVKFSAFFLRDINGDGYAEKIKGTCKQIGKEDTLYMEVNVQTDGILKNAKIEIDGKNFYLATTAPKDNELKDNYIGTNIKTLEFNDMTNGTQKLITGIVRSGDYSYSTSKTSAIGSNINNLSRNDNKIIFTGTYVGSDGNEIEIKKEVVLQTDWYGTTSASISTSTSTYYDIENRQNEEDGTLTLEAGIRASETDYQLNLKKNYVEGTIPQLNGYNPISVTSESSTDSFSYDETSRKFVLIREAQVDEIGNITKSVSRENNYTLKIIYPLEVYKSLDISTVTIEIPVMTYYEGYNNQNTEFTNPYKSNEAKGTLTYTFRGEKEDAIKLDIKVGEYMPNPTSRYVVSKKKPLKIYNEISSEEKEDNYIVKWYISKGTNENSDGLIMKERKNDEDIIADSFVKTDSTTDSMENVATNVGIGFDNADKFLAEDGFIKVYDDETDELLVTFTSNNWGRYTKASPYKFNMPVKHIRIETSETQASQYFYVYSQKQLDDEYITTNYTREQFDNLKYIKSNLNVYAGEKLLGTVTHSANYEEPYSIAELIISKNIISTQLTEKNEILTIKATANENANQVGWTNGSFLIKLPTDIITADINNVEINNSNISLTSYEYIENDNERFIKVNTQNTSSIAQTFEIKLDTNITPDPRIATTTETFELWASNEEGADYYYGSADIYDVNDNLNTAELVHKSTATISLIAPNSLLTNQTASGFDKSGTQVVSPQIADVKPQLATVSQDTPEKTVRIGAQIKNNYSSVITDVVMLGKIPFEGNTYVLSGEDLGSEFTTKMTDAGIEVPEALKDKVVVYYSENETPDKDLTKESNGWKTAENITNWDNVKTFLIDFKDTEVASGAEYTFYYTIKVPNGLDYNKKSFSHHGVYFALKTDEGKYKTQTEPNKLGLRIAEKYNLELQKYQTGKTNLVPGATYKITKEATDTEDEESKTAVTNAEGKLELQNLYAKRTYSIEEIKTPEDYELNTDVIKIIGTIQEDGSLQVEKTQGTTKEDIEITKAGEDEPYKVTVKVEDEAKAKLKIIKTEKDTTTPIRGVKYKLTGEGLPENGKNIATNANGEIIVKGLKIGEEYTLEEVKADGYYLATEPIKFTITNTEGTYEINVSEGTVKESTVTEEENLPTANIQIENEKIPTYDLEISKIKRVTSVTSGEDGEQQEETVYLQGAKFKLYKGTKELGNYITDENGKITISGLYQYIDGKDEEATYMLKETLAPEGYAKVKDITFKVDGTTGELKFINTEGKEEKYTVEETTVKLTIEDSPSFKLIKKDAETGELLANIRFAIYNIDNNTMTPAKNSKGETIGNKETINGMEYYTVTTDSNGEITADLPEGTYKAVEVQAPDKYDILDSAYYFGIGTSREEKEGLRITKLHGIGEEQSHDKINCIVATSDGGYLAGGCFHSRSIDLGNGIVLTNNNNYSSGGYYNSLLIKYNSEKEVEWAKDFGYYTARCEIIAVAEISDEKYIVVRKNANSKYDESIIEYNSQGELEKIISVDYGITTMVATNDGGYITGGYFSDSELKLTDDLILSNSGTTSSTDGVIVKYSSTGEVEWAKGIGNTGNEKITSISVATDGSYIVGGNFESTSIELENGVSIANKETTSSMDGMLIKYKVDGEVEWARGIGGEKSDSVTSVVATSDGGYLVGGYHYSDVDLGNGVTIPQNNSYDGMIIKYDSFGDAKWTRTLKWVHDGQVDISDMIETKDGEYIVLANFNSSSLDLGEGIILTEKRSDSVKAGAIIKYSVDGKIKFAKQLQNSDVTVQTNSITECVDKSYVIGGLFAGNGNVDFGNGAALIDDRKYGGMILNLENVEVANPVVVQTSTMSDKYEDSIESVSATSDGGCIVGGYVRSSSSLISLSRSAGKIIKYDKNQNVEWTKELGGKPTEKIRSVIETNDGGYIAGGYFCSEELYLGNGVSISSKGGSWSADGMIIKYDSSGNTEWAKAIGGEEDYDEITAITPTSDGGCVAVGKVVSREIELENETYFANRSETQPNYINYSDGIIIKYSADGKVSWAKIIGEKGYDAINSVIETSDKKIIVGGYIHSGNDGVIIKYSSEGEEEWTRLIGGTAEDRVTSIAEMKDGSYIVAGYFNSENIQLGNGVNLNKRNYSAEGMIIKYSSDGKAEWAIGKSKTEASLINDVVSMGDGGYIAGTENELIKGDSKGEIEWRKTITNDIKSVALIDDDNYLISGMFKDSFEIDQKTLTSTEDKDGFLLKITNKIGVPEIQELEVENIRKEYKITTDVKEIDNIKGGSISGEDEKPYERVKYGDTSMQEIKMVPDENYEIIGITINGEEYQFTANEDGSYTMPAFTNMTEDKYVEVTYALKANKITINKIDKNTKENLSGAIFKLDQIEERTEPNNEEIIGELTDNGQEYTEVNVGDEITGKLGELTNNGTYYFVQNDAGAYTPTNSKTYQTANGGTAGIQNSTANSYIPIDLTDLTGQYAVVVNASCSSESADKGYVEITENTTAVSSSKTGKLVYIYGTQSAKDYTSAILEGGKLYYLHMGYYKDGSVDSGTDQIVINSIKLYNASTNTVTYNFTNNDGKYESTNAGKDDTVSNSYVPIDLTNYTGKYNLTVNAEVSSQSYYDYGYATVTENETRPNYNETTGNFVNISGTQSAKDYTTVLQGGKMYYLHLGYYKDGSTSIGNDKFTVNSINITLNDSELYHTTVETNSDGQAITQIPFGKYSITEIKAPDGYWLNETPTIVEFRSTDGAVHEFTIEDEAKAKLTVHHYIKGTTTKLAEDEKSEAHIGDSYTTNPKLDLDKYELEVDKNGKLVLPENAIGTYSQTPTEVTYYYVEKKIPLTVHHYIEGTATQVPLKDGSLAEDRVDNGVEGEAYTTSPILDENLSDEYELAETQDNANGTYSGSEIIVTYYYKKVSRTVNLMKYQQDGKTPLQGVKFNVIEKRDDIVIDEVNSDGTYYFTNSNGKYISNNQNESDTTAKSYMKIDTTNAVKDITVTVNAEISSEGGYDIGYATITQTENAPAYNVSTGRFVYISGTQSAKDYSTTLEKGKVYYLHLGYRKDSSANSGTDTFIINSIDVGNVERHITNEQGKIQTELEIGKYEVTEIEAPEGYKLPDNPTTEVTITKATTSEDLEITNEKKTGTVTVHHYIEGTTTPVSLADGSVAQDENKTGYVGDMYATVARTDISEGYELVSEPENASGNYIDGNIEVIYYYKTIPASVVVHYYLEGTTTKLADDVTFEGIVGDNYTTGVGNVDNKYEVVAIPANANGKMTRETIEVIYYYRLKNTSVLVHHYKEGTSESLSDDVTINGKVDDEYTTTVATDIPSKYELVAEPDNKNGIMTVEQTVVTYYYRLKETGVDVHYYKEGTTEKVSEDVEITGRVDSEYTTTPATDVESKYELVGTPANATGTMTEDRITVIYYYRLKDTSVLVHHYLEGTTTKLANDEVINGQVDDTYKTVESTDLLFGKYDLVAEPENKTGTMTEDQIVVIYYYRLKNTSVLVHHYIKDTTTSLSDDVTINGKIDDEYTTTIASDIPEQYELVAEPDNKEGIMTKEQIVVTYYYQLKNYPYVVNYLEKDTDKVLHEAKQGGELVYGSTVNSVDEKIEIDGYKFDSFNQDVLTIGTSNNVINIYYTKRTDLSYKVNYLERDTNKVLHDQKVVENVIFEDEITSANEVIAIDGYNYDSVDKATLKITTGENIINIYYTKKTNLSYKVNYLEKDTNKILHEPKVQTGMTFEDEITSANEVIEIAGYNYDSVDKDTLVIGTNENVINIYYTKKEAKVTVHYYEKNTTNKVSEDKEITGKVNDEYVTAIADDIPSKYELVATPANATGTMTEDAIEVIYYFRKKATQVIVRHYEEGTTIKLSADVTIDGRVDDPYTTVAATDVPIKYELSVTPANANGTMTENTIEVIYYYRVKDAVLNIRYLEKGTEKELAQPEQQHGKVDEEYITGAKTIDGYTLVEHSGNERGKFEVNPLTVTYYYLYNTKATVQYIDKITGQILEQSTTEGLEGDDFVTESKSFDNYILVEEPAQKIIKMTKEEQVLKYYYIHVSGGVIEKHIDVISGEVLDNKTYEGNEGDLYDIKSKTFNNYDLVEDRLPANAQGTMTVNPIEVIYYYIYKSKVTVQYVDKNTGEKLTEDEVQNGHEKDAYITDRKTFDDYKLVEVPANADGEMTKEDITVTYNYVHTSGGVIVNHVEVNTNKQLLDETKQEGYEGDPYETHEENIPGYTLVKEKYPENAKGIMAREETRVTYYYVKNTEVNIKYIDKETGEEITEKTNIPGKEGENYTTEPKDIPGYDLVEEPENKDGTMAAEPIDVIYYYRRPAKVITRYIDQETNEEIATEEKQEGHQNDEYTTEAKDIKYYKLIATPDNATETMKVTVTKDENGKDIVEDTTYVTYYYRKLIFNLNIDKKVSSVTVNGEESIINGDLGKVEVHRKELNTAKVEVKYIIKVTNDSELTGKASILEDIPTGMTMNAEKNAGWEVKGTTATRETKELQPGESEEYLVVLDWENGENNIGMKENTASIISIENEAGFEEKDTTDNEDKADIIVAIGTGGHTYVLIAGGMLLILISLACGVYIIKKND